MSEGYRTRFAPTPSGYLHMGNLFNFVLTRLLADDYNARIFLRIDDMDQPRYRKRYARHIFKTLEYFGLEWEEGPRNLKDFEANFQQHSRLKLYQQHLATLWEKELLYSCQCSRKQVARRSADGSYPGTCRDLELPRHGRNIKWRWSTPETISSLKKYQGEVNNIPFPRSLKDVTLRKKDGYPAYQLTSVVDDAYYGINLIVRGMDLYDSSLAQVALAHQLDLKVQHSKVVHHPLIEDEQGRKLSKSDGRESLFQFVEKGKPVAGIFEQFSKMLGLPPSKTLYQLRTNWSEATNETKGKILQ